MGGLFSRQPELSDDSAVPSAVAVVDPYSSGRYLLYELKERGIPIVCVRSSLQLGSFFLASYETHKDYFVRTIDYNGDLTRLVAALALGEHKIKAVVAGCEPGVELADALSEALKVESNGTNLTWARRDKAGMQDRLMECGVPSAEQIKSTSIEELVSWVREREARLGGKVAYPVVVKPTGGSGGEGVFFCTCEQDLVTAHKELIGFTQTGNGRQVEQLALQEFLTGTEYIVDTCSLEGEHLCCAIWRYSKRKGVPWSPQAIVTQYQEILTSDGDEQEALVRYVFSVLDAVGLRHGPCHTEVMLTPRGPILVEVNARMHGVQGPLMIKEATGTGLASYVADSMMKGWQGDGGLLKTHLEAGKRSPEGRWMYARDQSAAIVMLVSHAQGYLTAPTEAQISSLKLPSVTEVFPSVKKGGWLPRTVDLNTMAGYAILLHKRNDQLIKDIAKIRAAEEMGNFYPVSADPLPMSRQSSPGSGHVASSPLSMSRQISPSLEKADELWAGLDDFKPLGPHEDILISGCPVDSHT
mmetsp:Transcript_133755/g.286032  ORF Transcript_133755/g.286032 Transcript_133755/m.286032 type:complete len:527 (-) Transcript_133755:541-2121(-)